MSDDPGMTMEEVEEAEENELLGGEEENHADTSATDDLEETPEDLMTDMKLEDEIDELRQTDPDFQWTYHIEVYPWSADDMTENFVRLLKLADFTQIFMRKKGVSKENGEPESVDDKLHDRQRKGSIHFYAENLQSAKNIIRSSTWKAMISKQLTFEITRRQPGSNVLESAYLEVDTYSACKCRYRDKPKGEFKDRTAKVSCIPGTISREFLDVVFCRAYAVTGGSSVKEYFKEKDGKLQQKLSQIKDFDGSLDFDCLSRGSCRAFVTAHKNVYIEGQRISIVANNKETMVAPPAAPCVAPSAVNYAAIVGKRKLPNAEVPELLPHFPEMDTKPQVHVPPSRASLTHQTLGRVAMATHGSQAGRGGMTREPSGLAMSGRGRGMARSALPPQRPLSTTMIRSGPGMPVPMTGRQKMNEKMRRSNQGLLPGPPVSSGTFSTQGGQMVPRNAMTASLGESFKQEIAALQKQLQQNTAELEAKIAMLRESTNSGAYYEESDGIWDETAFGEDDEYSQDSFLSSGDVAYVNQDLSANYHPGFEELATQQGMAVSDGSVKPDMNMQCKPGMLSQRGMCTASSTANQGMMAGHGMASHSHMDYGQLPSSFGAQMTQLQTRPVQMFQQMMGHMPQNMPMQMPQNMPMQMPQNMTGQMSQNMPMQMPQPAQAQLARALLEQMAQVMPADQCQGQQSRPMFKPGPGQMARGPGANMQAHPQRGGGRGGDGSFHRMRGTARGRGKHGGTLNSSPGAW
ncbi:hypothetical protein EGW08_003819 [Elysia chlorotica]|uniref:Uncharacterized protein n=1 Tax=Elysia chlorotica TaxID=188477 RepID=A0A3S0ZXH7_ELYCH|nr:hypothetical protein EGW08_003819 [Elysia chlorotica]